jgi:LPXTG-motif cell wall-anchored protein
MTRKRLGVLALLVSTVVIFALPAGSLAKALDLREAKDALVQAGQQVRNGLKTTVEKTGKKTEAAIEKTKRSVKQKAQTAKTRATATDPAKQPPMHGSNPHGQGNVAIADINPSNDRPLDAKPDGSGSGEEVIVGRARGDKDASGKFHGHITIAALFGHEIAGVDTAPGETKAGPLQSLQTGVLDPLCANTGGPSNGVCLSLLVANSKTTSNSSANDFAVARASLFGLDVGAAESSGAIAEDPKCQAASGSAKTVNVTTSNGTIAGVANSTSASKSCAGGKAPEVQNTSEVINLGGTGVPLPAPGCANGTPDTETGIPGLLPIICNAEEIAGAAAVREALDVFALQTGTNSLLKETTAASESFTVAPPEGGKTQCSDGVDNDGDGLIDAADPGCHTDGKPNNPASYDATDNDESNAAQTTGSQGPGGGGKPGAGNEGAGNEGAGEGAGGPQCSDGVDNDGDGKIDSADPGCLSGPGGAFNPNDDNEGAGAGNLNAGALPFTGTDVIGIALAGLLMLGGGLLLRRREDVRTVR